ncbi:SigE family RNA polymerase sigma factor [Streptacidiphilus sp. ASG 303]|uniref:SigE family RNA polymerase sigma factor n=1 Tax=Streptomycetaceae TaxID=2062 RepID=UPI001E4FC208|nr:SigE family RNA polymerase sigma factor [Streptacidiphilus sp. ASG 303]MCD0483995.1 SigE family RNA polymerase sigma factor [Streptacidiphilus sp. ASG 303]
MAPDEFDAFYSRSWPRLVGQLYAMTGNLADAQDVVQEAFVRAWDRREELSSAHAPEAWVRTVAWRLAVSRWRRARSTLMAWFRHGAPGDVREPGPEHAALVAALRRIPEEQRRAVVLHYLCDLPVAEVAAETGSPVGTVKVRLSRARATLARHLSDDLLGISAR